MADDHAGQLSENWATLWEAFADAQPDQIALVVGDSTLTWRELDDRAARLVDSTRRARCRCRHSDRPVDVQLPRVPRVLVCSVQAAGHSGQRQLPVQGSRRSRTSVTTPAPRS